MERHYTYQILARISYNGSNLFPGNSTILSTNLLTLLRLKMFHYCSTEIVLKKVKHAKAESFDRNSSIALRGDTTTAGVS